METKLDRIEQKLDAVLSLVAKLLEVLVEEDEQPERTLDGELSGGERDQSQSL